jgi:NAD(P)-dependent dehydrogenase (short-subunit alcohol dehydrogenase family)
MADNGQSWIQRALRRDSDDHDGTAVQTVQPPQLSGDSTVAEWLDHPVGGAMLRDMMQKAGQRESALRPVRRLAMKRLVAMSRGMFTNELLASMIEKANAGNVAVRENAPVQISPKVGAAEARPAWQERIIPGRFTGKTVIVTGAGSGIGRATASRIAREGGRVIGVDISRERLDELAGSLEGADVSAVLGDITSDATIRQIVAAAGERIDGLANVAGIMDNMTPLHEVSDEVWDKVLAVNVTGMMKLSRAVLPLMLQRQSGSIVNVASEAAFRGSAAGVAYTVSKHAVVGLTKSSAFMYAERGIRVNAVAPGPVLTNIGARFDSPLGEERINTVIAVAPEAVEAEALAASITFLLSDDAVNINGAILPSDGGWSVQ